MRKLLVFTFVVIASTTAFALGEAWKGKTLVATGDVFLRDAPPRGLFCTKGKQLGLIKKGEKVKVLSHKKAQCALVMEYDFIEVERLKKGLKQNEKFGFAAVRDTNKKVLFKLVNTNG
jgi:hypothetical protein